MLKWKEIVGCLNSNESARWEEIKEIFVRNNSIKGDDKMGQMVRALCDIAESLRMDSRNLG